jgi:hypothetical protein
MSTRSFFWKEFASQIERAVMGAIAQDGMEQAKQRMAEETIPKAKDGRVTAKVSAYGLGYKPKTPKTNEKSRSGKFAVVLPQVRQKYLSKGVLSWLK